MQQVAKAQGSLPTTTALKRLAAAMLAASLAACAVTPADESSQNAQGYGEITLALTGTLPDVKRLRVRIYEGPVTDLSKPAKYTPAACNGYLDKAGKGVNLLRLSQLKAGSDYSLLVELFTDDACTKPKYRAYRGGIQVVAGGDTAAAANPYYVQPYQLGGFVGLAQVNQSLQDLAAGKSCSQDADCRTLHVNATCKENHTCTVDHLFPLNGGTRRGLAQAVALSDGRVALSGGLHVLKDNYWTATTSTLEVFDPKVGLFSQKALSNVGEPVGLARAVTLTGVNAFALVGGTASAQIALTGSSLKAALDTRGCSGAGSQCAVSRTVARWSIQEGTAQQFAFLSSLALPVAATVRTKDGDRVLVAGGADLPINPTFDQRKGASVLCKAEASGVDCPDGSGPVMKVGRANAASACIERASDGACTKVLVVGGRKNPTSTLSEIFDAGTSAFLVPQEKGVPVGAVHGGELVPIGSGSFLLVGATTHRLFLEDVDVKTGGGVAPLRVDVNLTTTPPTLTWSTVDLGAFAGNDGGKRALATVASLTDGSVLLIGGLAENLTPLADALIIGPDGKGRGRVSLGSARFGASAARIGGKGPIGGCVLLAGGFAMQGGSLRPQNHVEVFCPAP